MRLNTFFLASALAALTCIGADAQDHLVPTKNTAQQAEAQQTDSDQHSGELTLSDIHNTNKYSTKGVISFLWSEDGKGYVTLERNSEHGGLDIVSTDIATGQKEIVLSASQLIPEGAQEPIYIHDYAWSEDRSKILIFTNSQRVWRLFTRGDYWVYTPATGDLRQVGAGLEPSRLMYAKLSPDGQKVGYVYYNNIYVEDLTTGERTQLTTDGSDEIINGNFDWVYEEELGQYDGWRWSSDSRKIAYWQFDTRGTGTFYMVNNLDSIYSQVIPLPYPKAGTTNSAAHIGVVALDAPAQTRWLEFEGDPRENYLARMELVPGTNEVMIQRLNRLQNTNTVYFANLDTMELTEVMEDTDEAFLQVYDDIIWLDGGRSFTWMSERSGWRHIYKVSRDSGEITPITKGEFDVVSVVRFDPKGGYVYYIASPDSPLERYLYRSKLNGKGAPERITPEGEAGHHGYNISPSAKYAMHTFSNSETPNRYELISLPKHKSIRVLQDNAELAQRFAALGLSPKEFFRVDIGEVVLDGWMIKPRDFDSTKIYPVIYYIYGEPASPTVQNSWTRGEWWSRFLAEQGYIVMSIDPRGVTIPRGREWRKSIYGKVGDLAINDHASAVRKMIDTYSFIDPTRIGIWGWSGGGSSTAHLMFKHPDIYSVGIAVAGVYSQYLYDTIYQERYMGTPQSNPEGFYKGSPINYAAGLQGDLLLIHGTGDDNVHYQSCDMLVNELIKHNKMFSMLAYPMRGHSIFERENTSYHLYQSMLKYWIEHLPAGARDRQ